MALPGLAIAAFAVIAIVPAVAAETVEIARVTGPVTGGKNGHAFMAAPDDLKDSGYVEQEFFLSGIARTYHAAHGRSLDPDGHWHVETRPGAAYRTRILVRRPADAAKFNGTVVVEWFQPSAGFDKDVNWMWLRREIVRGGYAWVGVSAQKESVDGAKPFGAIGVPDLVHHDRGRYGGLSIPNDDLSYDIFAQVGEALKARRANGSADPLGGLVAHKLIAVGNTFASDRLFPYYNAVQPLRPVFDGFVIGWRHVTTGQPLAADTPLPAVVRLRTDLKAPVMVLNSMAEAPVYRAARQPDGPTVRMWEVAGAAHTNAYWVAQMYARLQREFGMPVPVCPRPFNSLPTQHVFAAALARMNEWLTSGSPPASMPPLAFDPESGGLALDANGNALGGVRLPELEVPIARYEAGGDKACPGAPGYTIPFAVDRVRQLYPSQADYLRRYEAAAQAAVALGVLQPEDAAERIAKQRAWDIWSR